MEYLAVVETASDNQNQTGYAYDASGLPVTIAQTANGQNPMGYAVRSIASSADQAGYIWQTEILELKREFAPKEQKAHQDVHCMEAANAALAHMQAQIEKIPQPTWLSKPDQFSKHMQHYFERAAHHNHVPKSEMNSAVERYDLFPAKPADVESKLSQLSHLVIQLDQLIVDVDKKFNTIMEDPRTTPGVKELLLGHGITSADEIYAINPGLYRDKFMPKDSQGNSVAYDPKNILHNYYAVKYVLNNPEQAAKDGMVLYGPKDLPKLSHLVNQAGAPGAAPPTPHAQNQSMTQTMAMSPNMLAQAPTNGWIN